MTILADLVFLVGLGLLAAGLAGYDVRLAMIVPGAILTGVGLLAARTHGHTDNADR